MHAELLEDPRQVALDRLLAEEQRGGDGAVGLAGRDVLGDLPLARAEAAEARSRDAHWAGDAAAEAAQLSGSGVGLAQRSAIEEALVRALELRDPVVALAQPRTRSPV